MMERIFKNRSNYVWAVAAAGVAAGVAAANFWPASAPKTTGLYMFEPGRVGLRQDAWTETGRRVVVETLALRPRLFRIDDFLTAAEADDLLATLGNETERSRTLGDEGVIRVSDQAWIPHADANSSGHVLSRRSAAVTRLPPAVVHASEDFQAARYGVGGHYYLHLDSGRNYGVARFLTLLVYLNDVPDGAGGETAFPIADDADVAFPPGDPEADDDASMPEGWLEGDPASPQGEPWDLSREDNCRRRVAVAPRKGTAILFYNHLRNDDPDPKRWTDVGGLDVYSLHGSCDLRAGEKWVTNVWINPPGWHQGRRPKNRRWGKY